MIPNNISVDDILNAITLIDEYGTPIQRISTQYALIYNAREYSAKYVISVANKFANGIELKPSAFNGGEMTNSFLVRRGFNISLKGEQNQINPSIQIEFALRDERVNILAMTRGGLPGRQSFQSILCKHKLFTGSRLGPYLLDSKISTPNYQISTIGESYLANMATVSTDLCYIAYVDCQIHVKISNKLFKRLGEEGFFAMWHPDAPLKYFQDDTEGYLILFRVYRINKAVPNSLLSKGRKGRNFYYGLNPSISASLGAPVVDDLSFYNSKSELLNMLKDEKFLLSLNESEIQTAQVAKRYTNSQIAENQAKADTENKSLSLNELELKIHKKVITKKVIIVESSQYYRNPDIVSYAKKRAAGICEYCRNAAPFLKEDNSPFLEAHHLVPLSEGGLDSINNICALCPNCHRKIHYSEQRKEMTADVLSLRKMDE